MRVEAYEKVRDDVYIEYIDGIYGIALRKRTKSTLRIRELMEVFGDGEVNLFTSIDDRLRTIHVFFRKMHLKDIIKEYGKPSKEFFLRVIAAKIHSHVLQSIERRRIKDSSDWYYKTMKMGKILISFFECAYVRLLALKCKGKYALTICEPEYITEALKSILSGKNHIAEKILTISSRMGRTLKGFEKWLRGFDEKLWRLYVTKKALEE